MKKETKLFYDLLFSFLKKYNKLTLVYILILFLIPIIEIGVPHTIGKIVKALKEGNFEFKYICMLIGLIFCGQIITTLNDYVEIRLYPALQTFISESVLTYIMSRCKTCLQDVYTAKVIAMISTTPRVMYNLMEVWRSILLPQLIVAIVSFLYFSWYNIKLGLILLVMLVLYYVYMYLTITNCSDTSTIREEYFMKVTEVIDDVISNIVAVFNHNKDKDEFRGIRSYFKFYEKMSIELFNCTLKKKYLFMPFIIIMAIVFMYIGYKMVKNNEIPSGIYVSILIIFMYMFNSIIRVFSGTKDISMRWGIITENLKVFSSLEKVKPPSEDMVFDNIQTYAYILFDSVSFKYKNTEIIKNMNLKIQKGENILIIGHIGKGKTTLLKLLMRYKHCTSGDIYINGASINSIPLEDLRKKIGFIPQNPILMNRSLYDNITYGSPDVTREQVIELLNQTGLSGVFDVSRFDEDVGKHGSKLSGGQKQIVWILRVLLQNPDIILMDEPTSSIDDSTKAILKNLLRLMMKNHTVIIVSHDMGLSDLCNRVVSI
jgi:ATP-binding cassette subfamily B protein